MKKQIPMLVVLLFFVAGLAAAQSSLTIKGTVFDAVNREPLPGVIIKIKNTSLATASDKEGRFSLQAHSDRETLEISYIGFEKATIELQIPMERDLEIFLNPRDMELEGVEVFSTGYQNLSKERATGSFVALDNELVNRRVSTSLIDRLEDVTSGLIFNRVAADTDPISIRGRGTIFANTRPLIVIDNFPYDGPLENINPNDVESITVLRDAAAASIWGARAGNGVIVITTKSGKPGMPNRVSLNINSNFIEAPDLFYRPQISSTDFIEVEKTLFNRGYYRNTELSPFRFPLSPVVETLIAERDGLISTAEKEAVLDAYRSHDVREDLRKYFYRPSLNQQYALDIRGGTENYNYAFSGGYDNNRENVTGNNNSRLTLNSKNNWSLLNRRLNIWAGIYYTQTERQTKTELPGPTDTYIYDRLADENGMALPIIRGYNYRFINSLDDRLLDWRYYPLDEINALDHRNTFRDLRLNASLSYTIIEGLRVEALHQYWQGNRIVENLYPQSTYFTRNLINQFTQLSPEGQFSNAVPQGDILQWGLSESSSHNFRSQFHYNKTWNFHELTALGGFEIKDLRFDQRNSRYYGYNRDLGTNLPVDYANLYRNFHFPSLMTRVPNGENISGTTERFISYYANAGYTYKGIYGFSASARRDASNLFGVETNQRAVPLWSVGGSWIISNEDFFSVGWLDFLKLRTTYGFNGNVDRTLSSFTTALYFAGSVNRLTGLPIAQITNPPNPNLRWEKIGIFNVGVDFSAFSDKLSGSLEAYNKQGNDLIGVTPFPASSGVTTFRGNFADTRTNGMDLILNSEIMQGKEWNWRSTFLASYVNEKVTGYEQESPVSTYLLYGDGGGPPTPLKGRPLYAIYSYPWAGLDPATGMPMGFVDGEPSTDYNAILSGTTTENMNYHGPARPAHFGALRNDFSFRGFNLSVNISYRMGYYFRNESVDYDKLLRGQPSHSDFAGRWQNPGDELTTYVPAFPEALNPNRDSFYRFSNIHVEKADNIRLQDIRLGYAVDNTSFPGLPIRRAELYAYTNNLGIIWKASNGPMDPDFPFMRPARSLAFGLKLDF